MLITATRPSSLARVSIGSFMTPVASARRRSSANPARTSAARMFAALATM
jgi:hypothetical protein